MDDGESWEAVNNGLTATNVRALAVNSDGDIFAGTFGGVFRSTDDGDTWVPVNNGLEYPFVISLAINVERRHLRRARSRAAASFAPPTTARTGRWSSTA